MIGIYITSEEFALLKSGGEIAIDFSAPRRVKLPTKKIGELSVSLEMGPLIGAIKAPGVRPASH
jgi:hypothetical protein